MRVIDESKLPKLYGQPDRRERVLYAYYCLAPFSGGGTPKVSEKLQSRSFRKNGESRIKLMKILFVCAHSIFCILAKKVSHGTDSV